MNYYSDEKIFNLDTEYAKSDKAMCKGCHKKIFKDSLKFAYIVYSECYISPQWHHFKCLSALPLDYPQMTEKDVIGYNSLEKSDQKLISEALIQLNKRDIKGPRKRWDGEFDNPIDQDIESAKELKKDLVNEVKSLPPRRKLIKKVPQSSSPSLPSSDTDNSVDSKSDSEQFVAKNRINQSKKNPKQEPQQKKVKIQKNEKSLEKKAQDVKGQEKQLQPPVKLDSWKNILKKKI